MSVKRGYFLACATAVISGFSVFTNGLFVSNTDPIPFTTARNFLVFLILLIIIVISKKTVSEVRHLNRVIWLKLMAIGVIGGGIPFALFFIGLSKIGAVNGTLIHKSLFLWTALIAVPVLHEKLSWKQLIGYAAILYGTFALVKVPESVNTSGVLFVLAATVLWAIENVIAKKTVKTVSPQVVSFSRMLFGLPFLLAAVFMTGKVSGLTPGLLFAPQIMVSAGFLTVYMMTYYTALKYIPVTVASSILVLAPIMTAVLSNAMKGTLIPLPQVALFTVTAIGIITVSIFRKKFSVSQ